MKKAVASVLIALSVFGAAANGFAAASTDFAVEISTSAKYAVIHNTKIDVPLDVAYNDALLFSPETFASYHVLGKDGEAIKFDNVWYPVEKLNDQNRARVWITVDIGELNLDECVLQTDIVDNKNAYWMSQKDGLATAFPTIKYEKYTVQSYLEENFFVLLANALALLFVAAGVTVIKARRLFLFRRT